MSRIGVVAGVCMLSLLTASTGRSALGQDVINREFEIKALYLYHFGEYVAWPDNAVDDSNATFVIGVLGKDPLGAHLDKIVAGKTVKGKKIVVHRFSSAKDYKPCHILFVSGQAAQNSEEKTVQERLKAAVEKTKGLPVLLVSDTAGHAQKGAMISFAIEQNTIKLEINTDATSRSGLTVSSKLLGLKVVKIVKEGADGAG